MTMSISAPLGRDARPSTVPIYTPGWRERHCESKGSCPRTQHSDPRGGGGGDSHMKGTGMLIVSLRGVNFGLKSRLGCSGQNAIIYIRQGLA